MPSGVGPGVAVGLGVEVGVTVGRRVGDGAGVTVADAVAVGVGKRYAVAVHVTAGAIAVDSGRVSLTSTGSGETVGPPGAAQPPNNMATNNQIRTVRSHISPAILHLPRKQHPAPCRAVYPQE
jgi:hypothetical protein